MTWTRLWVRGVLLACVLALGLVAAGRASALSDGDPCSPFWTETDPPTAAFGVSPATVSTRELVALDATASQSGTADMWTFVSGDSMCEPTSTVADPIASYTWSFGDGSPPETDPVLAPLTGHTYARPGTYTIALTVTERNCQAGPAAHCFTNQAMRSVTVQNRSPVASFTAPASVATGRLASFDASGSEDFDGQVTGYHWDFGDGQSQDSAGPQTFHTYDRNGPKTVTLTVTDDSGSTGQSQRTVAVTDRPPSASFTAPAAIGKGQAASFDGSASSDPDGTLSSYRWDFGDGQVRTTATPRVSHAYTQRGPKTVTLTVTDDSSSTDQTQRTLTVTAALPSASFSAPPATIVGHPATFDASASSDPNGTITSFRWDFGDGQTLTTAALAVSHTYHTSGTMTVTLTITDDNGGDAATRGTIKVLPRGCVVPRLLGRKLGGARHALNAAGCRLGTVKRKHAGPRRRGRVIRQSLRTGTTRPAGTAVAVTIGK